jgi:hypothetical protein
MTVPEFHYRALWRVGGWHPGAHPGKQTGSGQLFCRLASFLDYPDPRRLDMRASLTDPEQQYRVRLYEQRASIKVMAVVDWSASMSFREPGTKHQAVADFIDSLALSAQRMGDAAGVVTCAEHIIGGLCLPATRLSGALRDVARRMRKSPPRGSDVRGLLKAAQWLPSSRSLVFLLSDFHCSADLLRRVLASLSRHQVVPVVLWRREEQAPAADGLAVMRDLESGTERLVWMRPQLRARLEASQQRRRLQFLQALHAFGLRPLYLDDGFDADAITRYFLSHA